jgi:hypothetical protein
MEMHMKIELMNYGAETLFHIGARRMKSVCQPAGKTPGFQSLGKAARGFQVEQRGNIGAISTDRIRSGGPYRTTVLALKGKNGRYRVLPRDIAEKLVPELPPTPESTVEAPKAQFTGVFKPTITFH